MGITWADLGVLLYAIEGILLGVVLLHAAVGIEIFGPSPQGPGPRFISSNRSVEKGQLPTTVSSRTMIITGTLLAGFLVAHLNDL